MRMRNIHAAAMCGLALGLASMAGADEFTWQGRLLDLGGPANGVYDFEFELYDQSVGGNLVNGITQSVDDVNVVDGLITVDLDFGGNAFGGGDRWLQINVKADADGGYTTLSPRQPIQPTPYAHFAFQAAGVGDGGLPGVYNDSVNFTNPGNQFAGNGSGLTKLNASELLTGNVNAARMPTGGQWDLASGLNIDGGAFFFDPVNNRLGINTTVPGDTLTVVGTGTFTNDMFFGSLGSGNIRFDVSNAQIGTFNGSTEKTRLWGATWGELLLWDSDGDQTAYLASDGIFGIGAGQLILRNEDASINGFQALGGFNNGGQLNLRSSENVATIQMNGEGTTGGTINMFNDAGVQTVFIDSDNADYGLMSLRNSSGSNRLNMYGGNGGNGLVIAYQDDGSLGVAMRGDAGTNIGGEVSVYDENGTETVEIRGSGTGADGAQVTLSTAVGQDTIILDGDIGGQARFSMFSPGLSTASLWVDMDGNNNGRIRLFEATAGGSDEMVVIHTESTGTNAGGQIVLRNDAGVGTIELDANWAGTGDGRIRVDELQILGGSDLSEQFDIAEAQDVAVEPGMVVCIDAANPGKLILSTREYDITVAGIVSGAGGVKPGMLMGQEGSLANGEHAVALTGRVYVWCDASNGAIEPGHLLTTSSIPGHAMRATDRDRSHGAIIGKAMTRLDEGAGLVLVLVNLH